MSSIHVPLWQGVLDTRLFDNNLSMTFESFSRGTPDCLTNRTDWHYITIYCLKWYQTTITVTLVNHKNQSSLYQSNFQHLFDYDKFVFDLQFVLVEAFL